jgi:protein-L-isoaspartate(D-aspartate) O-methyltransferase
MIMQLKINNDHNILEIGTGRGYNASIISKLCKKITTVEISEFLHNKAKNIITKLQKLKILNNNIILIHGDGKNGYKNNSPYDRIIITAVAYKEVPHTLLNQLADKGIMMVPIQEENLDQYLYKITKFGNDYHYKKIIPVQFVPLV